MSLLFIKLNLSLYSIIRANLISTLTFVAEQTESILIYPYAFRYEGLAAAMFTKSRGFTPGPLLNYTINAHAPAQRSSTFLPVTRHPRNYRRCC